MLDTKLWILWTESSSPSSRVGTPWKDSKDKSTQEFSVIQNSITRLVKPLILRLTPSSVLLWQSCCIGLIWLVIPSRSSPPPPPPPPRLPLWIKESVLFLASVNTFLQFMVSVSFLVLGRIFSSFFLLLLGPVMECAVRAVRSQTLRNSRLCNRVLTFHSLRWPPPPPPPPPVFLLLLRWLKRVLHTHKKHIYIYITKKKQLEFCFLF